MSVSNSKQNESINPEYFKIMLMAFGFFNRSKRWQNQYLANWLSKEWPILQEMVSDGYMTYREIKSFFRRTSHIFRLTNKSIQYLKSVEKKIRTEPYVNKQKCEEFFNKDGVHIK